MGFRRLEARLICLVVALSVAVATDAGASDDTKVFQLNNGTAVIGVVVDESDTAYIVRTTDGETKRIEYGSIAEVYRVEDASSSGASGRGTNSPLVSDDGFSFSSARDRDKYEKQRLLIESYNRTQGTWSSQTTSRSSGASANVGRMASSAIDRLTGTNIDIDLELSGSGGTSDTTNNYNERQVREYKITTGDGIVLSEFNGTRALDPRRVLDYLGKRELYTANIVYKTDTARLSKLKVHRDRGVAVGLLCIIPMAAISIMYMFGPELGSAVTLPWIIPITIGFCVAGSFSTKMKKTPKVATLAPWHISDLSPHIYDWNEGLLDDLGAR